MGVLYALIWATMPNSGASELHSISGRFLEGKLPSSAELTRDVPVEQAPCHLLSDERAIP